MRGSKPEPTSAKALRAAEHRQDDPAVEGVAGAVRRDDRLDLGQLGPVVLFGIERRLQLDVGPVEVDDLVAGRVPDREDEAHLVEDVGVDPAVAVD